MDRSRLSKGWVLLLLLLILFLGQFFSLILSDAASDIQQEQTREVLDQGGKTLVAVEREIPPLAVMQSAVKSFLKTHKMESLNETQLSTLDRSLRVWFHSSAKILWFDPHGRVLNPGTDGFGGGATVWQALWKALQHHSEITPRDQFLARNLLLTFMGRLLSLETLETGIDGVTKVFIKGSPRFFSLLRFRNTAGKIVGSCFLSQSENNFPYDWSVRRAIRRNSLGNKQVGAWRFSRQEEVSPSPLEPNLLPVLVQRLKDGKSSVTIGPDVYLSQFSDYDPDLMLSVRLAGAAHASWQKKLFHSAGWWVWALVGTVLFFLLMGRKKFLKKLSLRGKLILGGGILVVPPVLAGLIFSVSQARLMEKSERRVNETIMENRLQSVEAGFVDTLYGYQKSLNQLMKQDFMLKGARGEQVREYCKNLFPWKDYRYFYLHRTGSWFNSTGQKFSQNDHNWQFLITLLKGAGFLIPPDVFPSSGGGGLSGIMSGFELPESKWQDIVGRFAPTELGASDWLTFPAFSTDSNGQKCSFFFFTLKRSAFRAWFLEKEMRKAVDGVGLFFQGGASAPARVLDVLDRASQTGRPQFFSFSGKSIERLVLARPLRGLDVAAAAVITRGAHSQYWAYSRFLILALFVTVSIALWAIRFLRISLYSPIMELGRAIAGIEAGTFEYQTTIRSRDELQELGQAVESLGAALAQRARMTSFVRSDLILSVGTETRSVERKHLAVMFAGLRSFREVEQHLSPDQALETMGRFLALVEAAVVVHGGQIDKFIGDTAMVVFLPCIGQESVETRALKAAVDVTVGFEKWMNERTIEKQILIQCGVGIAAGEALTGSIGSLKRRLDFTVIGDVVNLAARLEKLGSINGNPPVLSTGSICQKNFPGWFWQPIGIRNVRGRSEETPLYGLIREEVVL